MLYFRGCTAREKEKNIASTTETLLKTAGIQYEILEDEKCCGSVLLRTGFKEEAKEHMAKNLKDFKGKLILTSCAGCYKTLTQDYEGLDVIHISQLIDKLINEGKIKFTKKDLNLTYHDPCHLGRHSGVYEPPRSVIKEIANLTEMKNIKENSSCCGAGGGVKSSYPELAKTIANRRIAEAKDTGADILITSCPFCKLNLKNSSLEVLDLTEFLVKYMEES
jgi:Fe-S oxidoreductase